MHKYEFYYLICDTPDDDLFYRQCAALEKNITGLQKDSILEDVDGSLIQVYRHAHGEIQVTNSYYHGELCVESDFDLFPYFKKE